MSIDKIEKLWRLATKNPNKNEAMVAARKFIEAVQRENVHVHISATEKPLSQQDFGFARRGLGKGLATKVSS